MINERSIAAVEGARWGERFRRPLYESYCFSRIPDTVRSLLTGTSSQGLPGDVLGDLPGQWDTVVLIVVDALGWRFLEPSLARSPFVQRLVHGGVLSRLTSQFPSTTAAHITTLHTGLSVGQSGIYAWTYYEPLVGTLIVPLRFAFAGQETNSLRHTGLLPGDLFPGQTIYQELARAGVRSWILGGIEYSRSPYSQALYQGALVKAYRTLPEAYTNLLEILAHRQGKTYCCFYYDKLDTLLHFYGPNAPQVVAEIDAWWLLLEHLFHHPVQTRKHKLLLLLTADHGHVAIDPEHPIYLNREMPEMVAALQTDRLGRPLFQAGSRRDQFLHVRPECLDALAERLRTHLAGRAEVHPTRELIEAGFFGPEISDTFLRRVGNLVVLPYQNESVRWYEPNAPLGDDRFSSHGGLTPEEMEIPLLVHPYG